MPVDCPNTQCKSKMWKNGITIRRAGKRQRWLCPKCGRNLIEKLE